MRKKAFGQLKQIALKKQTNCNEPAQQKLIRTLAFSVRILILFIDVKNMTTKVGKRISF